MLFWASKQRCLTTVTTVFHQEWIIQWSEAALRQCSPEAWRLDKKRGFEWQRRWRMQWQHQTKNIKHVWRDECLTMVRTRNEQVVNARCCIGPCRTRTASTGAWFSLCKCVQSWDGWNDLTQIVCLTYGAACFLETGKVRRCDGIWKQTVTSRWKVGDV